MESHRRPRWRRRLFAVLTVLATLALLALAGEAVLRLSGVAPRAYVPLDVMQSEWWLQRPAPGEARRYSGWMPMQVREFDTLVRMNAKGWRDAEYAWSPPPDTWRLLVLGDSYVEGREVPLEATFHKVLERRLRGHGSLPGSRVEVVALGLGGSGPADQLEIFERVGARFAPDVVLHVLYPGNDVGDSSPELYASYDRWLREVYVPYVARTKAQILRHGLLVPGSWLNHFLVDRAIELYETRPALFHPGLDASDLEPRGAAIYGREPYDAVWREAWERTLAAIERTRRAAEATGADYALVLAHSAQVPGFSPDQLERRAGELDLERPRRIVREFSERHDIPLIDLGPALAGHARRTGERYAFRHDAHWNETGHRVVAEALERWLVERYGAEPAGSAPEPASHGAIRALSALAISS